MPAHNFIAMAGRTFGDLTVVEQSGVGAHRQAYWLCRCSCRREIVVLGSDLRRNHTTRCKACGQRACGLALRKWAVGDVVNGRTVTAFIPHGYRVQCLGCHDERETKTIGPCSTCRHTAELKAREERKAARKAARQAEVAAATRIVEGDCLVCGKHFARTVVGKATPPMGCTKRCCRLRRDAIKSGVSRAKEFGVTVTRVDPYKIFARDKWKCQICLKPTVRSFRGTSHGLAPELDHIIPIEHGGPHTDENTQCAHRRCNEAKLRADLASVATPVKMTPDSVTALVADRRTGMTTKQLAEKYGIAVKQVRAILGGRAWTGVDAGERLATLPKELRLKKPAASVPQSLVTRSAGSVVEDTRPAPTSSKTASSKDVAA